MSFYTDKNNTHTHSHMTYSILPPIRSLSGSELVKQSVTNIAKCIAGICSSSNVSDEKRSEVVTRFARDLSDDDEKRKHLALLCVGELGQLTDLKNSNPTVLKDLIVGCFNSKLEGTKTAAAYALGRLAVGNMTIYLPVILESIGAHTHQYLLLVALKEVIVVHASHNIDFTVFLDSVLPGLLGGCRAEEEVGEHTYIS